MRIRLKVRGPMALGGYDVFLDDHQICAGVPAEEAARYISDAWQYGAPVFPEYLNGGGGIDAVLPPDIISALQSMDALPDLGARGNLALEEL